MENIYDIDRIIKHVMQRGIDISPADRKEWRLFCCALKVLGYSEQDFISLSSGAERDSRQAWRAERNPSRYKTEDSAKGMIVELAKSAGVEVKQFLLSQDTWRTDCPPPRQREQRPRPIAPAPVPDYLTFEMVNASEVHATETNLFAYMAREFGKMSAHFIFGVYHIGASKHTDPHGYHANSFPYIDAAQRIVDCKLFHINPTTGSRKTAAPLQSWSDKDGKPQELRSSWALAEINRDRRRKGLPQLNRASWCNFGDHLLQERPTAEVALVESEKTALIAALTYPDKIWIAVGSKNNLTLERSRPYIGRTITIFPDRDGYNDKPRADGHGIDKGWRTIARELAAAGLTVRIDTTTERHEGGEKDDIADLILRYRHGEQCAPQLAHPAIQISSDRAEALATWAKMKYNHPELADMEQELRLEVVGIELFQD